MSNLARVGALCRCVKFKSLTAIFLISATLLGCASSNVSRTTANSGDVLTQDTKGVFEGSNIDVGQSYQNANQATKGALIGGAAGGLVGAMSTRIGFWPGLGVGALLGLGYGAYVDANTSLQDQLINRGVNIVVLGDHILMVIPSYELFEPATAQIKPSAYSTLRMVSQYINSYTKIGVKISAYTNPLGPKEIDLALSQQQAESVERFLVSAGTDARLIYAEGYGGTHLVERSSPQWDASDNYRVEISMEKLYV